MDRLDEKTLATFEKPGVVTSVVTLLIALTLVALVIFIRFHRFYAGF